VNTPLPVLDNVRIASPCNARWEDMAGDDRRRFCEQCSMHVYNVAGLTRDEATRLLVETEGRLCGRLYRRPDGTIITADCPVGLRRARKQLAWLVGEVAAGVMVLGGLVGLWRAAAADPGNMPPTTRPFGTLQTWLDPDHGAVFAMGEMVAPTPAPTPPPAPCAR